MPLSENFIENLIEMRSHYGAQIQQSNRLVAHAQENLSHINALLVDKFLDNQQFVENLLQMRSHYQSLVDEQKQQIASAKDQLVHINALLAEQVVVQHLEGQTISLQASTITDDPALTEATEDKELSGQLKSESVVEEEFVEVDEETEDPETNLEPEETSTAISQEGVLEEVEPQESLTSGELPTLEVEDVIVNPIQGKKLKTPLLQPYQHLNKSEAVEKLLQENIGSILHVDYIVRSLYGQLESESFKIERQKIYETMSKGVAKGFWDKVPNQPGCYTIDLKLVDNEGKSPKSKDESQAKASPSKETIEVLPAYQQLSFTKAVETVLRENAGLVMDSEKVARILYGNLEAEDFTEVKGKVGKVLWSGANQKRWQGVPGKLGAYTLDLKL